MLTPEQAGVERFGWDEIAGGDPSENAEALAAVLAGAPGRYRDAVIYSGAAGLLVAGEEPARALPTLAGRIAAALDDGSAAATLDALVKASNPA